MIWVSSLDQLQINNQCDGIPCYCEALLYPSDLLLQGTIPAGQGSGNYGISIEVWTADGQTALEADNSNFDYYFFVNPITQEHNFNIRLKKFTSAMCQYRCFLIRVGVWNSGYPDTFLFANWTERYCISDCCEYATGVEIEQNGEDIKTGSITVTTNLAKACDNKIIRIISDAGCINNQNGKFYSLPTNILSGSATFEYADVMNIRGRFMRIPREIQVQRSFNCDLQRTLSTRQYRIEGFEYFPDWKMNEIEDMFHTGFIYITDFNKYNSTYNFAGGTIMQKIETACCDVYKMDGIMTGCEIRQTYGCDTPCAAAIYYFVIPQEGTFYSDSGDFIAEDIDGLIAWFQSQSGVTTVTDEDLSCLFTGSPPMIPCDIEAIISFQGTGAYPSSIYINSPIQPNRIYAVQTDDICNLCGTIGVVRCDTPVIGSVSVTEIECDTPVIGTPSITEITPETLDIFTYGQWAVTSPVVLEAFGYGNSVNFSMLVINTSDFTGTAGQVVSVSGVIIGYITGNGVPTITQNVTYSGMPNAVGDITVTIDTQGYISISGDISLTDVNEMTIDLSNVNYQLS